VTISSAELLANERYLLSGVSRSGFSVDFYSGTSSIEKSYSYTATGYGRAI
jgi:hypothetical protein